jgi:hypothetical protein
LVKLLDKEIVKTARKSVVKIAGKEIPVVRAIVGLGFRSESLMAFDSRAFLESKAIRLSEQLQKLESI